MGVILALLILLICPRMLGPISQWPSDSVPGDSEARAGSESARPMPHAAAGAPPHAQLLQGSQGKDTEG
jgi:hypothetical protein